MKTKPIQVSLASVLSHIEGIQKPGLTGTAAKDHNSRVRLKADEVRRVAKKATEKATAMRLLQFPFNRAVGVTKMERPGSRRFLEKACFLVGSNARITRRISNEQPNLQEEQIYACMEDEAITPLTLVDSECTSSKKQGE